jgi:hypothetical protein
MAERNLHVDHVTMWRWVQRYAPELDCRCRRELRITNGSWRVDETYLRVAGRWSIYIGRWIRRASQLVFCCRPDGCSRRKAVLPESLAVARPPASPSDQCGRKPVVSEGDHGVEQEWRTGTPVSLPTRLILEQHRQPEWTALHPTTGAATAGGF